jgi:predicted transcriptional regulator
MAKKRPDGTLENDVLSALWAADRALTPSEVQQRLDGGLAYTSVATTLVRLHAKGLVERHAAGRAFDYEASFGESQLAARRLQDVLASTSDRVGALAGFVGGLSARDVKALRALLKDTDR